jgi:hypothetical protein
MRKPFSVYLAVVLVIAGVLFGWHVGRQQAEKFGCLPYGGEKPAAGWMDVCISDRVGSGYGQDAIWFDLEPSVAAAVRRAKVLIFGDSRIMEAVSRSDTSEWFAARDIPFYLLAFGGGERSGWAEMLLDKFHPKPAVMIFDADPYFTGGYSLPVQAIRDDPKAEEKTARGIHDFMATEDGVCRYVPWVCGRTVATYRAYKDGHLFADHPERFYFGSGKPGSFPITKPPPSDTSPYDSYVENARKVLAKVAIDPRCVVFTVTPNSDQDDTLAKFLALRLGGRAISPQLDGLTTSDHWHMTAESSQRWADAFLKQLQPVLDECLGAAQSASAGADNPIK